MDRPDTMAQAIEWGNAEPPRACWAHSGCGRIELAIIFDDARSGMHQGRCDEDIAALMQVPYIAEQLAAISEDVAREVATEYGRNDYGHGPEDMHDHQANLAYVLWMACGDIIDDEQE